jgi:hypothetical protein
MRLLENQHNNQTKSDNRTNNNWFTCKNMKICECFKDFKIEKKSVQRAVAVASLRSVMMMKINCILIPTPEEE